MGVSAWLTPWWLYIKLLIKTPLGLHPHWFTLAVGFHEAVAKRARLQAGEGNVARPSAACSRRFGVLIRTLHTILHVLRGLQALGAKPL